MRRTGAETYEGDIGAFARGQPADVDDIRGVCDDGMAESGNELREQDNALLTLVRDQDTQPVTVYESLPSLQAWRGFRASTW
jgi:hypothetical protein